MYMYIRGLIPRNWPRSSNRVAPKTNHWFVELFSYPVLLGRSLFLVKTNFCLYWCVYMNDILALFLIRIHMGCNYWWKMKSYHLAWNCDNLLSFISVLCIFEGDDSGYSTTRNTTRWTAWFSVFCMCCPYAVSFQRQDSWSSVHSISGWECSLCTVKSGPKLHFSDKTGIQLFVCITTCPTRG